MKMPVLAVALLALLGLFGCDSQESTLLGPEVPDVSMAKKGGEELTESTVVEECSNCLVPPTPISWKGRQPRRSVARFTATRGEKAELVIQASNPRGSMVLAWFNRNVVLKPSDLPGSDSDEIRVPLDLEAENLLRVQLLGRPGGQVIFWVEGDGEEDPPPPLFTDVVVLPTESPSAPVMVADQAGLAILLLTDPVSGNPEGAGTVLPGFEGMGLLRFDPWGVPSAAFFGGGAAYLGDWSVAQGAPSVSVTIPAGGPLPATALSVALPDAFAPVVDWFLSSPPTSSPGAVFGPAQLQALSQGEALATQTAWCALEVAGVLPSSTDACRVSLLEGLPLFWDQWTEELGFEPFLPDVTKALSQGGCTGAECLAQAEALAMATMADATPRKLSIVAGDGQTGTSGAALPEPIRVLLTNEYDVPLAGFMTDFSVVSGGGFLNGNDAAVNVPTDAAGVSEATWTLGPEPGTQGVSVTTLAFGELEVAFVATAEEGGSSYEFQVTPTTVSAAATTDKNLVCSTTFGSGFAMADWTEVADAVAEGFLKDEILSAGTAFISNGGSATTGGFFPLHYIISASGAVGTTLDTIGTDLFWLSSSNSDQRVLCKGPTT